ncbi:glycosyltransferase family 2 protein [Pacificimonas flava]|uniref:glycosyltransferase family 2 protein n=1 Tax=Pacificimonas flava TaxID=1234595 RepID=UPI0023EA66F5|nr:glycosyltransferase family A protein [Pacificimonas flava]
MDQPTGSRPSENAFARVSVVIPLYNKGPHIVRALESVLAQTLPPLEIIIIDDASADDGPDRVEALTGTLGKDAPPVRLLSRSIPGPGGYAARNFGIFEAEGDWIAFLDADDVWKPDHLASMERAVSVAGNARFVFSGIDIVSEAGTRPYRHEEGLPADTPLDFRRLLQTWLRTKRCPVWTGAAAFRRDVLLRAGLFPAGTARRGGDKDLWLRAMADGPGVYSRPRTAEFHQDTVNRVTKATLHVEPPLLIRTIRTMLPSAAPGEKRLLKRLANMELALYARHAAGKRARLKPGWQAQLFYPSGAAYVPLIAGFGLAARRP